MNKKLTLKQIRNMANLTQAQLAKRWNIDVKTIINYEKGVTIIGIDKFLDLCELAGIDPKLYKNEAISKDC